MAYIDRGGGANGDQLASGPQAPAPAAPTEGQVRYVGRFCGFDVPWVVDADGRRTPDLSSLERGTHYSIQPAGVGTSAVPSAAAGGVVLGYAAADVVNGGGTITHPALTIPGTPQTNARRTLMTSAASDNQVMGVFNRDGVALRLIALRSATARLGGWFSVQRFALPGSNVADGTFVFAGLAGAYGTLADCLGVGWFTTDATGVHIKRRANTTTTSTALDGTIDDPYDSNGAGGAGPWTFPTLTRALVQAGRVAVYTGCLPGNTAWIGMRIVDELTGVVHFEGRFTAGNLPTVDTGLGQDTEGGTGAVGNESGAFILADFGRDVWTSPASGV
jgi:hypothetical protein